MKQLFIPAKFRLFPLNDIFRLNKGKHLLTIPSNSNWRKAIVVLVYKHRMAKYLIRMVENDNLLILTYKDFGKRWSFSFYKQQLLFYVNGEVIVPTGCFRFVYNPRPDNPHYQVMLNFNAALDSWQGPIMGAFNKDILNSSKAYQTMTSIKKAIRQTKNIDMLFPRSYIIKGKPETLKKLLQKEKMLVVKSNSNLHCRVVADETFQKWDWKNLEYLPTFFQQCVLGSEIRVHVIDNRCWAGCQHVRDSIDWKFTSKEHNFFRDFRPHSKIKEFCTRITAIDNLTISGIDILKNEQGLFCLECNPNPLWTAFHSDEKEDQIASIIIKKLSG